MQFYILFIFLFKQLLSWFTLQACLNWARHDVSHSYIDKTKLKNIIDGKVTHLAKPCISSYHYYKYGPDYKYDYMIINCQFDFVLLSNWKIWWGTILLNAGRFVNIWLIYLQLWQQVSGRPSCAPLWYDVDTNKRTSIFCWKEPAMDGRN